MLETTRGEVATWVVLSRPIVLDGRSVVRVAMLKPTEAENEFPTLGCTTLEDSLRWVSRLTGLPVATLMAMPLYDWSNLLAAFVTVLESYQLEILNAPGCDPARPN